jgi:hypothetical protein
VSENQSQHQKRRSLGRRKIERAKDAARYRRRGLSIAETAAELNVSRRYAAELCAVARDVLGLRTELTTSAMEEAQRAAEKRDGPERGSRAPGAPVTPSPSPVEQRTPGATGRILRPFACGPRGFSSPEMTDHPADLHLPEHQRRRGLRYGEVTLDGASERLGADGMRRLVGLPEKLDTLRVGTGPQALPLAMLGNPYGDPFEPYYSR